MFPSSIPTTILLVSLFLFLLTDPLICKETGTEQYEVCDMLSLLIFENNDHHTFEDAMQVIKWKKRLYGLCDEKKGCIETFLATVSMEEAKEMKKGDSVGWMEKYCERKEGAK